MFLLLSSAHGLHQLWSHHKLFCIFLGPFCCQRSAWISKLGEFQCPWRPPLSRGESQRSDNPGTFRVTCCILRRTSLETNVTCLAVLSWNQGSERGDGNTGKRFHFFRLLRYRNQSTDHAELLQELNKTTRIKLLAQCWAQLHIPVFHVNFLALYFPSAEIIAWSDTFVIDFSLLGEP
jgi:hypothetical protein